MSLPLTKFIADSGFCSRREAEKLIRNGSVKINGRIARLGEKTEEGDEVLVRNKRIKSAKNKIYLILNKPAGYTCTRRIFAGEKNVYALINFQSSTRRPASPELRQGKGLKAGLNGLKIAGRLDKESRGLLLLTNDGELVQKLTHPKFEHRKKYLAEIFPSSVPADKIAERFRGGIDIGDEDGIVKAKEAKILTKNKFEIVLAQGKKRQLRRMFRAAGTEIKNLQRTEIASLKLGELKEGGWRKLEAEEIKILKNI